jgi:peptidoglycan L-alanyl-D-glutamate endopeptidase CwlK
MSESPSAPTFVLGRRSKQRLDDCHPDLAAVIERAIQLSRVDFTVMETLRTHQRQRHLKRTGKSQTLNSRHLPKVPKNTPEIGSTSHAVDLGAWVNGTVNWDWEFYFNIANAVKAAAEELSIPIKWGGSWSYLHKCEDARQAHTAYIQNKKAMGQKSFPDGPHFELCWEKYPV